MPTPTSTPIDFSLTTLSPPYTSDFYAKILDSVFTPAECATLLSLASTAPGGWKPAGLRANGATETVHSNFRNSDRVLRVDEDAAGWVYEKLRPLVQEIWEVAPGGRWAGVTGKMGRKQGGTWRLARVNPRLSFLRYGPGHYFKPHCDGLVELEEEDGKTQKSFVTLHVYLNGDGRDEGKDGLQGVTVDAPLEESALLGDGKTGESSECRERDGAHEEGPKSAKTLASNSQNSVGQTSHLDLNPDTPLTGGATRFWTPNKKAYLDVHPCAGRVLVFQQRMLVHSGEEVVTGTKYTMRSDFMFEQV